MTMTGREPKRPETDAAESPVNEEEEAAKGTKKDSTVTTPATTDGKPSVADTAKRRTLFVRSLPYTTTTDTLSTHFSFVAPIKHATVVIDPATKKSRGFGFVTFADSEDAQRAIQEFNGADFEGRKLKVELAELRHRESVPGPEIGINPNPVVKRIQDGEGVKRRSPRLIIRNLPWSVKEPAQLVKVFQSYGKVKDVIIPKKRNGEMCGFAFVAMKGYKNAEKAIEKTNGMTIGGRIVAVDWAVEKAEWEERKDGEESEEEEEGEKEKEEKEDGDGEEAEGNHIGLIDDDDAESMDNASSDFENDDAPEADDDEDEEEEEKDSSTYHSTEEQNATTIFIRNLPFTTTDESLHAHFTENFGPVRYARVVLDNMTERPRGTAFVCFYNQEHFDDCLKNAPRQPPPGAVSKTSILQNEQSDPTGKYTLDSRILSITRAVRREEAAKLQEVGASIREKAQGDKRRLFLLQEGTIPASSPVFKRLSPSEQKLREASLKQRQTLLKANPTLHLSLTRLSIRNLPRSIDAKDLKQLAREAIVGFSKDMKAGLRAPLSKEEMNRGGDEDRDAERRRKKSGKGVVRQAKIIEEKSGAGRSRGYGFIEYTSHRWALMGLRWLNGHEVGGTGHATVKKGQPVEEGERKKRLIVEFAIENAQVVARRREKEEQARERSKLVAEGKAKSLPETRERKLGFVAKGKDSKVRDGKKGFGARKKDEARGQRGDRGDRSGKRKREDDREPRGAEKKLKPREKSNFPGKPDAEKAKEGNSVEASIIARKRQMRKRKAGK
ncbi:RNA recognition motif-containing protein [Rhizina undulata]